MTTLDNQRKSGANMTVIDPAGARVAQKSLAVLEQMYGYFSYEPMPLEADRRLAA